LSKLTLLIQNLPLVGGSFDIITLININLLIENITNYDKVDRPATALVFHLVKAINPDKVALRVLPDIVGIALNEHS